MTFKTYCLRYSRSDEIMLRGGQPDICSTSHRPLNEKNHQPGLEAEERNPAGGSNGDAYIRWVGIEPMRPYPCLATAIWIVWAIMVISATISETAAYSKNDEPMSGIAGAGLTLFQRQRHGSQRQERERRLSKSLADALIVTAATRGGLGAADGRWSQESAR